MSKSCNLIIPLILCLVFAFISILSTGVSAAEGDYLTFTAQEDNSTISFTWSAGDDVKIRVSSCSDKIGEANSGTTDWQNYAAGTTITLTEINDYVQFQGKNVTTGTNTPNKAQYYFSMSGKIAASGDVTSLTNGVGGDAVLTDNCYGHMFNNCSALTTAPELPSTTLADGCYYFMFNGCTSLTAPAMINHVTDTAQSCCSMMYYGCSNLKIYTKKHDGYSRPWLATTDTAVPSDSVSSDSSITEILRVKLAYWAYEMFYNCAGDVSGITACTTYYIKDAPSDNGTGTVFTDSNMLTLSIMGAVLLAAACVAIVVARKRKAM